MTPILRNILAVVAGIVVGMVVNMGIALLGSAIIPVPEGVDVMDPESIRSSLHLFGPQNFIFPFLAHALGTLTGAAATAFLVVSHKMRFALGIGIFFLIAGSGNLYMISSPTWFAVLDLVVAYIPMGWLAGAVAASRAT